MAACAASRGLQARKRAPCWCSASASTRRRCAPICWRITARFWATRSRSGRATSPVWRCARFTRSPRRICIRAESDDLSLAALYWRVGEEGLLAHCFHLHPILVYPRVKNAPFTKTIDGDYLEAACPDPADTYIITDSDEFSAWELSDVERRVKTISRAQPLRDVVKWIREQTTPRHRILVKSTIRIHTGPADEGAWRQTEREADGAIGKLLMLAEQDRHRDPTVAVQSPPDLRLATALRGLHETRLFLDIALPSALAAGNIPRLPLRATSRYTIALPQDCAALLHASSAIAELRQMVKVDLRTLSTAGSGRPWVASVFRAEIVRDAAAHGAAAIFIEPDVAMAGTNLSSALRVCTTTIRAPGGAANHAGCGDGRAAAGQQLCRRRPAVDPIGRTGAAGDGASASEHSLASPGRGWRSRRSRRHAVADRRRRLHHARLRL